jgi:hypothetical protein
MEIPGFINISEIKYSCIGLTTDGDDKGKSQ